MEISVQPGRYIVAVSGGVDSMSLLHLLHGKPGIELRVAHFDHGIRSDSPLDRQLVAGVALQYGLPFFFEEGNLGPAVSEAEARAARYAFLERIRAAQSADAIITAHHQDDVLETAILNLLRGTGRKGLSALMDRPTILRPLLSTPKQALLDYAQQHSLTWREDSTNVNDRYLRNYVRHQLMTRLSAEAKMTLLRNVEHERELNQELDALLTDILTRQGNEPDALDRHLFAQLPHAVAKEVLASWLRAHHIADFDAYLIERVTVAGKIQPPGTIIDLIGGAYLRVGKESLALHRYER